MLILHCFYVIAKSLKFGNIVGSELEQSVLVHCRKESNWCPPCCKTVESISATRLNTQFPTNNITFTTIITTLDAVSVSRQITNGDATPLPWRWGIGVTTVQKVGGTTGRICEARRAEAWSPKGWERGWGSWGGCSQPPPHQLGGLGERCKLPQRGLGRSPEKFWFWCILGLNFES